ncbi:hypothetical protein BaRGS_00020012 [Batillaria attramentaria]|uniref:Uncharacterized protein n=1 Tax=Batillaria attramentaria TaxID=370345 RepID=A0ABD0KN92_9CAEN
MRSRLDKCNCKTPPLSLSISSISPQTPKTGGRQCWSQSPVGDITTRERQHEQTDDGHSQVTHHGQVSPKVRGQKGVTGFTVISELVIRIRISLTWRDNGYFTS